MDGSAFNASWKQLGGEWLIWLTPINPARKLPGRGVTLTVEVTRKDGAEQRIPVRVEDWMSNAAGRPYAALARPERKPRKGKSGTKGRKPPAPAMPGSQPQVGRRAS